MYLFASYNLLHKTHQYSSDSIQVEFKLHNSWKIPNKNKCNWENQSLTQQRKKEFREQRIVIKEFHTNRWQLTEKNQWSSVEGNIYYEKWKIVIVNCISKPHADAKEGMERARIKLFFLYQASKNSSQLQAVNYFCKSFIIKINNRHTKKCDTCLKVTIKTPERRHWRRSGVFIVNFEHISHLFSVFLLLTLNK